MPKEKLKDLSRLDFVKALIVGDSKGLLRTILKKNHLRIYAFSDKVKLLYDIQRGKPLPRKKGKIFLEKIKNLVPEGRYTRLGQCLLEAKSDLVKMGYSIASVLVFTDGQSNAGIPPTKAAYRLLGSRIPLFLFGVGSSLVEKDLELISLNARKKAKVGDFIPFHVRVRARGVKNQDLYLLLKRDGKVVYRHFLHISGKKKEVTVQEVRFQYKVNLPGKYHFTLEIPPVEGEVNRENNKLSLWVEVKDTKLWVLYVDGYPRWEYRYLKNALIRDRTLKVQCLLVSADREWPQESSEGVTPLQVFPYTVLPADSPGKLGYTEAQKQDILRKLKRYNVVILGDVPPSYFHPAQLAALRQFVEEGGGLVVISGEKYMPAYYYDTPLSDVLPVVLERPELLDTPVGEVLSKAFRPRLTPEGENHVIFRFDSDPKRNKEIWRALPGFYWFALVKRVKPGAIVLAHHPDRKNKHGYYPLFVLQSYGEGYVFFSALDSTWRWRAGVGDRYFYGFWSQVIRYTSTGSFREKQKPYQLMTGQSVYVQGKPVDVYAIVRKSKEKKVKVRLYGPFSPSQIQALHKKYRGKKKQAMLWRALLHLMEKATRHKVLELPFVPGSPENYQGEFVPFEKGVYLLVLGKLRVTPKGELEGGDVKEILVEEYDREMLETLLNHRLLRLLAQISRGKYIHLFGKVEIQHRAKMPVLVEKGRLVEELESTLPHYEEELTKVERTIPLWKHWGFLFALLLLLTLEWFLRKVFRLL